MYTTYLNQIAWEKKHFLGNWWSGLWRDTYTQVSALIMMVTIAVSLAMPSSDTITVIGGVLIAVGAMITGILKAALPFLEMKYKHQENMARMQAERIRSQMPDSEVEDDPKTKQPPNDHAKVARVRRRRKDKPQPPDEPDEQNHEPGQ